MSAPEWLELRRRPLAVKEPARLTLASPGDVAQLLRPLVDVELVECFWLVILDAQNHANGVTLITRGILNGSLVHPREVFRLAIVAGAAGVVLAHNHPSGNPTPSAEDRAVTVQMVEAGKVLDIPVYDHVILTVDGGPYFSFSEAGLL